MVEERADAGLVAKHPHERRRGRLLGEDLLHDERAAETLDAVGDGAIDLRHAADRDSIEQEVPAELREARPPLGRRPDGRGFARGNARRPVLHLNPDPSTVGLLKMSGNMKNFINIAAARKLAYDS